MSSESEYGYGYILLAICEDHQRRNKMPDHKNLADIRDHKKWLQAATTFFGSVGMAEQALTTLSAQRAGFAAINLFNKKI